MAENSNRSGENSQNDHVTEKQRKNVQLSAEKMLKQWKKFLDEQFSQDPRTNTTEEKHDPPNGEFQPKSILFDQTKTEEEPLVLEMVQSLFYPMLKILNSSQYFYYEEVTKEIEKVMKQLKENFHSYFASGKKTMKVDTRVRKLSANIRKKNMENKERKETTEIKINSAFSSMWKSVFQTLKSVAEKVAPEPIKWTPDCIKLYMFHFDSFIKSIASSTSPGFDQKFQKQCREQSLKTIETVCTASKFTCSLVNEYSQKMSLDLEKNICFLLESEFNQCHENTVLFIYNKIHSQSQFKNFQTAWNKLDDLTKTILVDYSQKFRTENHQIRLAQVEIAEKAGDFALNKYNSFMNNATSQGAGVFTELEILNFHSEAYQKIKTCFIGIPHFKYILYWKKSWERTAKKLKELEKDYLDKNQLKIERTKLQRKNSVDERERGKYQKSQKERESQQQKTQPQVVRNIKKGRDDVSVQLEEAAERITDLERKIQVFTGPHDNTEFRQLREDNVKISQDLDDFDLMGRSDLRDERRVLLTKLRELREDLAKKIHINPHCRQCRMPASSSKAPQQNHSQNQRKPHQLLEKVLKYPLNVVRIPPCETSTPVDIPLPDVPKNKSSEVKVNDSEKFLMFKIPTNSEAQKQTVGNVKSGSTSVNPETGGFSDLSKYKSDFLGTDLTQANSENKTKISGQHETPSALFSSISSPFPSTSTTASVSSVVKPSTSKVSSTTNLHSPLSTVNNSSDEKEELVQSKNELNSLVQEVKSQLEKSQSTSSLIRNQIEELLAEIDKLLNGPEPFEAALLKSYGEKLKIRAKRIK